MFLLELVMQGVRGFRNLTRLRFQNGFNFIAAGNEAGKTTSVDTVLRLLFPNGQPGLTDPLVSRSARDSSRGALVVCANDGAYYRVIQDFAKRAVNLSKYNAATKEFVLMHKDWDSAAGFMAGLAAGMSEDDYAKVFILHREHYANRCADSAPAVPRPLSSKHAPSGGRAAANEAKLAELREALRRADDAANVEYKLESAKIRLGELAKKLADLEDIDARYADIEANLAALKGCEGLPADVIERLEDHEQRQNQKMAKVDELQRDIEGLNMQIADIPSTSLLTEKLFILGALLGMVSFVAGVFILKQEQADYFPAGVLAAVALIAAGWYKGSRKNAQKKVLQKEVENLVAEIAEMEKSFEDGGKAIIACMKATGSATAAELKDKTENYRYFQSLRGDIVEQRQRLLGGVSVEDLGAEYHKLQQEIIELEREAGAVAQYAVDTYSIRQEIERIESESDSPAPVFGIGGKSASPDLGTPAAAAEPRTFGPELSIAARAGGIEIETIVPAVQAAAQRNFSALTSGRYVRVDVGIDDEPAVYDKADTRVSYSGLSHGTRGQLYFCLRAGLVEAVAGKIRFPFLLDDPFAGFDQTRQRAACQILRALGSRTQVILFSSNPTLRAEGDAAAELA